MSAVALPPETVTFRQVIFTLPVPPPKEKSSGVYSPSGSVVEESNPGLGAAVGAAVAVAVGAGVGSVVGAAVGSVGTPPVFTAVSDLKVSMRSYHLSFFRECAATETGVSNCTSGSS